MKRKNKTMVCENPKITIYPIEQWRIKAVFSRPIKIDRETFHHILLEQSDIDYLEKDGEIYVKAITCHPFKFVLHLMQMGLMNKFGDEEFSKLNEKIHEIVSKFNEEDRRRNEIIWGIKG